MEFYLSSFGLHNPYVITKLPEHAVFPISNDCSNGLDLDYTSLLLGKKYYIDKDAFDYICYSEKSFLKPMASTLSFLKEEELIEIIDVAKLVSTHLEDLKSKVETLSKNTQMWFPVIRQQWSKVKHEYKDFQSTYGDPSLIILNTEHFAAVNYLTAIDESDNYHKLLSITKLIESRKSKLTKDEQIIVEELSKPLLAQILINELIRVELNIPILDWDDNEQYYKQFYATSWEDSLATQNKESKMIFNLHQMFDCSIPSLKPQRIETVVNFIRNEKAIDSLRKELWSTIQNRGQISGNWYEEFINRLMKYEITNKKRMKIFKWLGTVGGLFIPGLNIIADAAIETTKNVIEDKVESIGSKDFTWYYTLQQETSKKNHR